MYVTFCKLFHQYYSVDLYQSFHYLKCNLKERLIRILHCKDVDFEDTCSIVNLCFCPPRNALRETLKYRSPSVCLSCNVITKMISNWLRGYFHP